MALAFSSNDHEVIEKKVDIDSSLRISVDQSNLEQFFEVDRSVDWIRNNNYSKIALQFPDVFLENSSTIALILEQKTQKQIFILADTSYGSCCVDEVAAKHVSADAIIHYGEACLSPTRGLPVLFIFGRRSIDIQNVIAEFKHNFQDSDAHVIVFFELTYSHATGTLVQDITKTYINVIFSNYKLPTEDVLSNSEDYLVIYKCGRSFQIPISHILSSYSVFYIGCNQRTLTNLMLSLKDCQFVSYNPIDKTSRLETLDVNKFLRKRYYLIEKAKDAKIIGILVGTLGVCNFLQMVNHLRTLIMQAGKKSYTIVVGKLNDVKLANFSEIEIYVYVSCPESCIVDSHNFFQPIITPYELEIACNQAREWIGDYITDFTTLLPGASLHIPIKMDQEATTDMSLVTGKIRNFNIKDENNQNSASGNEIMMRDKMTIANIHSDAAGEVLANRIWKGLEQQLGQTEVSEIKEGHTGIASSYENEGDPAS